MFWIEPLQSSSRLGTVVWVSPFMHLGHSESWTVVWPCGPVGERVDEEGKKLFAKFMALSCTAPSLSDLHGTVCTKHERSGLCIKAEGVLKARNRSSLPFLFFTYK